VRKLIGRYPQVAAAINLPEQHGSNWLLQANANFFDLRAELADMRLGQENYWPVSRYTDEIRVTDRAVLSQGGPDAGIYATAEIISDPDHTTDVPESVRTRFGSDANQDAWVRYRLTGILNPPISKTTLQQHSVLKNMIVLRAPVGTNFPVTDPEWDAIQQLIGNTVIVPVDYDEPSLDQIRAAISGKGLRFSERTLRRYHLSLKTHGFVILSGISGGGKTQLARTYAEAIGAQWVVIPVAPNWNTNEDLLGFFNPLSKSYIDTSFSSFLRRAAKEYRLAVDTGRTPVPFHVILDEMNLARVEQYFAKFLSAMEFRASGEAEIELAPGELVDLTPNLFFIGTVNVDETTHGFANKVYDRAQPIEVEVPRELISDHLDGKAYQTTLLELWDRLQDVAPFGFRVLDEIDAYVSLAADTGISWQDALDDQLLQKVLPKLGGAEDKVGNTLVWLAERTLDQFPLTHRKAAAMAKRCQMYGFTTYF
jgi:MoxR-like ATPase